VIDGLQFLLTLGLYAASCSDSGKIGVLAFIYIGCLFIDFGVVSRPPPTMGVPPAPAVGQ
jgi:hypothetical protein